MFSPPPTSSVPDLPGSYQFKDGDGRILYVGKAGSLRRRLSTYFSGRDSLPPSTLEMLRVAKNVEWITVPSDVDALLLENELIKRHQPRFNVRLRDDKSYPWLAVTLDQGWPRAMVVRGRKRDGVRYFGPYGHARAIRETLDLLLRTFPIRTCSDHKMQSHARLGRPCLLFHIEKCSGPCVGEIDSERYKVLVEELMEFLSGDTSQVVRRLESEMEEAAHSLEYERAARLRDRLISVNKAIERQQMVLPVAEDLDLVGIAGDELELAVQVFFVRHGCVVGRKGLVVERVDGVSSEEVMDSILQGLYSDGGLNGVPRQVLVPDMPSDVALFERWLGDLRGAAVSVKVPKRGTKRRLMETVSHNAEQELNRQRLRRASDHNVRACALNDLQRYLGMSEPPLRIECYDMSHHHGTDYVGSMVVMEDGLPRKGEYRHFKIRDTASIDDLGAMEEVLTRRLTAFLEERARPVADRKGSFSYPPQLILVDGGRTQLAVAQKVVHDLGLDGEIAVAALAKRFEEVFVPDRVEPIEIERPSEALYLLQRIRDEAHRFAVEYHRRLRGKRMRSSVLDVVKGIGPTRRSRLIKEFGGVGAIRAASLDELLALSWLPDRVAESLHQQLHTGQPSQPVGSQGGGHAT